MVLLKPMSAMSGSSIMKDSFVSPSGSKSSSFTKFSSSFGALLPPKVYAIFSPILKTRKTRINVNIIFTNSSKPIVNPFFIILFKSGTILILALLVRLWDCSQLGNRRFPILLNCMDIYPPNLALHHCPYHQFRLRVDLFQKKVCHKVLRVLQNISIKKEAKEPLLQLST